MDLGKHVVDKELVDSSGRRAGKVDDLMFELEELGRGELPRVAGIVSGPMALSRQLPRPLRWLAYLIYRALGLKRPHPAEIPWEYVSAIDVVVHLSVDRTATYYDELSDAVVRRFVGRLPGA